MGNKTQSLLIETMDSMSTVKLSAEESESLMYTLYEAFLYDASECKDYLGAVRAIHGHIDRHLELLGILESQLKNLQEQLET